MIATLTFSLPDEATEHAAAVHGLRYAGALQAIREAVRSKRKYGHDFASADEALDWAYALVVGELEDASKAEGSL